MSEKFDDEEIVIEVLGVKWFRTIPIHKVDKRAKEEKLKEAKEMSEVRESLGNLTKDDGRYCPICYIAADIQKDVKCPKCRGHTFRFGWT